MRSIVLCEDCWCSRRSSREQNHLGLGSVVEKALAAPCGLVVFANVVWSKNDIEFSTERPSDLLSKLQPDLAQRSQNCLRLSKVHISLLVSFV